MTEFTMDEALRGLLTEPSKTGRQPSSVTAEAIEVFELAENVRVPDDLKEFWLAYGAPELSNDAIFGFTTWATSADGERESVSVGAIGDPGALAETRQRYLSPLYNNSGPRLPEGLYPLTFDHGYGHCLVDLTREHHGRIVHIVIEAKTFGTGDYGWQSIGAVADDFSGFLASLTPDFL